MAKSSFERERDLARALDFTTAYQRRKFLKAVRAGGATQAERLSFIERDLAARREREKRIAERRAERELFRNDYQYKKYRRAVKEGVPVKRETVIKADTLKFFNITVGQLAKVRLENRRFVPTEFGALQRSDLNIYDLSIDSDEDNWSVARIGYIIAYHAAVVNPRTNYNSLTNAVPRKKIEKTAYQLQGLRQSEYVNGYIKTNSAQYWYLVHYAKDKMTLNDFETRYGSQQLARAEKKPLKP